MGYATIRGRFLNPAAPVGGNARPLRGKIIFRPTSRWRSLDGQR